jgi:hypothetical protein
MSVIDTFLSKALKQFTAQIRVKGGIAIQTLTGAVTVTAQSGNVLALDPGGASRDVTMPPEESCEGAVFVFYNTADAAENLVVKNDAAGTIVTIGRGESYIVACSGSAWTAIPMREVEGAAGLLSADTISELTAATGVTIDGLRIQDSTIKPAAGGSAFVDLTACATGEGDVMVADNLAIALEVRQSTNSILKVTTTNDAERITAGYIQATTPTTVAMADAAHTLVLGTAGANQTKLVGNLIFADPESGGASENLQLPAAASLSGVVLHIVNTGGEGVVVLGEAAATVITLDTLQHGWVASNGTGWYGAMGAVT